MMFSILKFTLAGFLLSAAFAFAQTPREICLSADLESLSGEASTVRRTYSRDIKSMTDNQIRALPLLTKQHIIIVAKDAFNQGYEPREGEVGEWSSASDLNHTIAAVEFIRQINENRDEELLYTYLKAANGMQFRRVTYYPGALVGRIYAKGTLTTVAEINDGDVTCVD